MIFKVGPRILLGLKEKDNLALFTLDIGQVMSVFNFGLCPNY